MGCSPDPDVPTSEEKEWERLFDEADKLPIGKLSFLDLRILLRLNRSDPPNLELLRELMRKMKS